MGVQQPCGKLSLKKTARYSTGEHPVETNLIN
jgi:hypothetical protein